MKQIRPDYNPLYFLIALGAGGLSAAFFMYVNFMVPHKHVPMATFDFIYPALMKGDWLSYVTAISLIFVILFAFLHFKLLWWNLKEFAIYKKSAAYESMRTSNAEVTLLAIPLTLAMTINVMFVLGASFVPGLWDYIEYLLPGALLGFLAVGCYAFRIFSEYFTRLLINGDFDFGQNNSLSQMLSIFAFAMVAVGLAAPGAMSKIVVVNAIGIITATFFISLAVLLLIIKIVLGFKSMFKNGISAEAAPSLWIMIPILTLLGITLIRVKFGLDHHFEAQVPKAEFLTLSATIVSLQVIFATLGYSVMKRMGYFKTFVFGDKQSVPSFALICPGVAFTVFWLFFVQFGLVLNGVVEKYSIWYFIVTVPILYIHYKTVYYFFKLKSHFAL